MELLRQRPTIGAGGARVQFVHPKSTGGILLELSQPREEPAHSASHRGGGRSAG